MSYGFSLDDVAFLRSASGSAAVADCATLPLTDATRIADVAAARRIAGEGHAAAVIETVVLRRKAASKVNASGDWLFTGDALQQASATAVARHRASRLAGLDVHDVTCSVGAAVMYWLQDATRRTTPSLSNS